MELQRWNPFKFKRTGDGSERTALAPTSGPTSLAAWTPQAMLEPVNRLMSQVLSERFLRDPFEPFGDLSRFFGDYAPTWFRPAIDVVDEGKHVRISAELPGMNKDEIEVLADGDMLTIRGEKKVEQTREEEGCYRTERYFGRFSRSIPLPDDVDVDKAEAKFQNGVLTLRLPKTKTIGQSKSIEIKA